jgi:AhpC/TSA family
MRKGLLSVSALRVFLSVGLGLLLSQSGFGQAQVMPDFTFYRADGHAFGRKDVAAGKPVLFVLFDPTCPHCQRAVRHIGEQYAAFSKAEICLVSMEGWAAINGFVAAYGGALKGRPNVVVLRDVAGEFIGRFKPMKFPAMMLFSRDGRLVDYEDNENAVFRLVKMMPVAGG